MPVVRAPLPGRPGARALPRPRVPVACLAALLALPWLFDREVQLTAPAPDGRTPVGYTCVPTPMQPQRIVALLVLFAGIAADGWAQLKKTGDVEIKGGYLLRLESQGTRLNETIKGVSYTGQRYEFLFYAQRGGKLSIPEIVVDLEIKSWEVSSFFISMHLYLELSIIHSTPKSRSILPSTLHSWKSQLCRPDKNKNYENIL